MKHNDDLPRNNKLKTIWFLLASIFLVMVVTACSAEQKVETYISHLTDAERKVSEKSKDVSALIKIGEPAIQPLLSAFGEPENTRYLYLIAEVLSGIQSDEIDAAMLAILENPAYGEQVGYAAKILGEHKVTQAVEPLIAAYWKYGVEEKNIWAALFAIGDVRAAEVAIDVYKMKGYTEAAHFLDKLGPEAIPIQVEKLGELEYEYDYVLDKNKYGFKNYKFSKEDQALGIKLSHNLIEYADEAIYEIAGNLGENINSNSLFFQIIYTVGGENAVTAVFGTLESTSQAILSPALDTISWLLMDEQDKEETQVMLEENLAALTNLLRYDADLQQMTKDNKLPIEMEAVSTKAAWLLGKSESAEVVDILYAEADHPNSLVREQVIRSLVASDDQRSILILQNALLNDGDLRLDFLLDQFAELQEDPLPVLITALENEDPAIRIRSVTAMGKTADPAIIPYLTNLLDDENVDVVKETIRILGNVGDAAAISPLAEKYATATDEIKELILTTMAKFEEEHAAQFLWSVINSDDSEALVRTAKGLLLKYPLEYIPALNESLTIVNYDLQYLATLGKTGQRYWEIYNSSVHPELQNIANYHKYFIARGDPEVEDALVWALRRFGDKSMATYYLNCGNETLEAAAREWAKANGYTIIPMPSSGGSGSWGSGN